MTKPPVTKQPGRAGAQKSSSGHSAKITVERLTEFGERDLADLCEATTAAIRAGGGFGWIEPPPIRVLETYWRGVLLVPERQLIVGRIDDIIAGAVQLVRWPRNNEAQAFSANLVSCFVAPWGRGLGLAKLLIEALEAAAREAGIIMINLDLRETQKLAIRLVEHLGYRRWGENPFYAKVGNNFVEGFYYSKFIDGAASGGSARGYE